MTTDMPPDEFVPTTADTRKHPEVTMMTRTVRDRVIDVAMGGREHQIE